MLTKLLGFNAKRFLDLRHFPKYFRQYLRFQNLGGLITGSSMVLADYDEPAGSATGHYFHQDLLVASYIHHSNPRRHIDIGSRIDGFVAHVASFRKIEVMDVRALKSVGHENISFIQADLMNDESAKSGVTDSISCLHAIEHFGLGRYGDPLDPNGHKKGLTNILRMLKIGGLAYISFPIAKQNQVVFNAHRIFHPLDVFTWLNDPDSIQLERFDYVDDFGNLHCNIDIKKMTLDFFYGCGIYTFRKIR
jgi:hypothetical protein